MPKSSSSLTLGGDIYSVEKIIDKRIRNGNLEYFIKWEGYSDQDNTWENADNVYCDDLVTAFEAKVDGLKKSPKKGSSGSSGSFGRLSSPRKSSASTSSSSSSSSARSSSSNSSNVVQSGIWEKDVVEVVTMERDKGNQLIIHLRWKDGSVTAHDANVANINCPQKVIRFYEERLRFKTEDATDRNDN